MTATLTPYDKAILAPVSIRHADVRLLLEKDEEFFIQFFMGDELTWDVPDFHVDIFHLMTNIDIPRLAIAVPRDHAKTTLAKLSVVWYFLFSPYSFVVYLSNTATVAQNSCSDIIGFLENENFQDLFGNVDFNPATGGLRRVGDGLYKFKIWVYDREGKRYEKTCILKALGAGQQVRGLNIEHRRPQVAVVDDLEDKDNIATPDLYDKLKSWFFGTFRKALDKKGHKIIQIGNMISNKCLLKENCESRYWHSIRYGCILANGDILWPDAWTLEKLRHDFAEYLEAGKIDIWFAEMMNLPIVGGMGLIKASEIRYAPLVYPENIEYGFITVDPAISHQKWAHKAAVVVHGWVGDHWQIVDFREGIGLDPLTLFRIIHEFIYQYRVYTVGVENTAYQASLQYVFPYIALTKGLKNVQFVPLIATVERKPQRFMGWATMLKAGEYALTEGEFTLTQQLLTFDPNKIKELDIDLLDAASYGPQMIQNYLPEIMSSIDATYDPNSTSGLLTSREVEKLSG